MPQEDTEQGATPGCERHRHADKEQRGCLPLQQHPYCLPGGAGPRIGTGTHGEMSGVMQLGERSGSSSKAPRTY